jgi:hypothetical protein
MSETLQTAADLPKIGHILKSEDIYTGAKLSTFPKVLGNQGSQSIFGLMYGRFVADFSAAKNFITIY